MVTNTVLSALANEHLNRSIGYRPLGLWQYSRNKTVYTQSTDTRKAVQSMLREFCMVSPDQNPAAIAGPQ